MTRTRTSSYSASRKAMPRGFWWTDQVKSCKTVDRAWEILDIEFANKRKLMDELLTDINNHGPVKGDSKSLSRYATAISVFVNGMEDNGCSVQGSSEAPFFMSSLLSKHESKDNADFWQRNATWRKRGRPSLI